MNQLSDKFIKASSSCIINRPCLINLDRVDAIMKYNDKCIEVVVGDTAYFVYKETDEYQGIMEFMNKKFKN